MVKMLTQQVMTNADQVTWRKAADLWSLQKYFEVHEILEVLWLERQGVEKDWLAGVILVAAALHKGKTSLTGRRRNLAKALRHLELVPADYQGFPVAEFRAQVVAALQNPELMPLFPMPSF